MFRRKVFISVKGYSFKFPNFNVMKKLLSHPVIFDGRNVYDKSETQEAGFDYFCIGIDTTK